MAKSQKTLAPALRFAPEPSLLTLYSLSAVPKKCFQKNCRMEESFRIPDLGEANGTLTLVWSKSLKEGKRFSRGQKLGVVTSNDGTEIPLLAPRDVWIASVLITNRTQLEKSDEGRECLLLSTKNLCKHNIAIDNLCAECGMLLTPSVPDSKKRRLDDSCLAPTSDDSGGDHIKLGFVSSEGQINVSKEYAQTLTSSKISSLLQGRKLMLVLDLDSTLAHASEVKPPIDLLYPEIWSTVEAEVLRLKLHTPPHTPSHTLSHTSDRPLIDKVAIIDGTTLGDSLKVDGEYIHYIPTPDQSQECQDRTHVLESHIFRMKTKVFYYSNHVGLNDSHFKLRPGVIKFLRELSDRFELYMYTAGTKEHAESALHLLDPDRRFFGNRVFARTSVERDGTKSLNQILPTDHEMIVVIDDTSRVWASDVSLFMCYPYFWHTDDANHFVFRAKYYPEPFMKWRASKVALCQFSPYVTHANLARRLPKAGSVALVQDPDIHKRLESLWAIFQLKAMIGKECPKFVWDTDLQLYALIDILSNLHDIYFELVDSQATEAEIRLPSCKEILMEMKRDVLQGVVVYFENPQFQGTDIAKLTEELGARIIYNTDLERPTHVVTEDYKDTTEDWIGCAQVDMSWLECAICTLCKPPEALFAPELCAQRRQFWDVTKSRRHPRGETSEQDVFEIDRVAWHAHPELCVSLVKDSRNIKSHDAVFPSAALEDDLLAELLSE
eukprot:Blabericola_migrator_1__13232@NODE_919_length_6051_cov_99_573529_g640_i0_p2_GENE_NODE_919_length_6051_cov_99_573529_g640_i0NODE_919_length_6051_cov_99_573529_g640_i0_p2_ORF_typecomplete_len722_score147_51NIF/PF03031_18/4_5e23HAD_2/PF13419_6/8_7e03HAD_2/PF13419_6/0_002DUF705/PF05152_12/12DUF705/PF05152_12/1_NODE_919_length_6051_cov_99_573529_g640_i029245089